MFTKNKKRLILDSQFDSLLIQSMNELKDSQVYIYDYKGKDSKKWVDLSRNISIKAKDIIDNKFLYPPSTNQYKQLGYITRPKNTEIDIKPFGNKKEIIFTRKIF